MGKRQRSFLAAKAARMAVSVPPKLQQEQKLIRQLRGLKIVVWLTFVHHDSIQQPGSIPVNIWVIWIKKRLVNSHHTDSSEIPFKVNYTEL